MRGCRWRAEKAGLFLCSFLPVELLVLVQPELVHRRSEELFVVHLLVRVEVGGVEQALKVWNKREVEGVWECVCVCGASGGVSGGESGGSHPCFSDEPTPSL